MRAYVAIVLTLGIAACGTSASTVTGGDGGGGLGDGASGNSDSSNPDGGPVSDGGVPTDSGPALDAGPVSAGTTNGTAVGAPFGPVATALWIGAPDDPATTVVYVFNKTVACGTIAGPGWDGRITDGTQFLEMKMFGTMPATYKVVTTPTPAAGEAAVNHTLSAPDAGSRETGGKGGTVTLTAVTANTNAAGSFALTFGTNMITGTYNAAFCPGGSEP